MSLGKKTGGRKKGTPNKTTGTIREKLAEVTSEYYNSKLFMDDVSQLKPNERVMFMERLTAYVSPKMQATTIDATVQEKKTIEEKLIALSSDSDNEE